MAHYILQQHDTLHVACGAATYRRTAVEFPQRRSPAYDNARREKELYRVETPDNGTINIVDSYVDEDAADSDRQRPKSVSALCINRIVLERAADEPTELLILRTWCVVRREDEA